MHAESYTRLGTGAPASNNSGKVYFNTSKTGKNASFYKHIKFNLHKSQLFAPKHKVTLTLQGFIVFVQRRLEARPSMHRNSLIFTIVISCNVSWKSCGNLFRFFAKKISSF